MRYRDKKSYYERAAPVREICNLLTNDGECALRDVEVGARFATEDDRTNVRIHRRNFVPQNAAQLRNHFTSRKTALSLEVGMILPKMLLEELGAAEQDELARRGRTGEDDLACGRLRLGFSLARNRW